jgi:flagellar hook assembly protein FlgD
MVPHHYSHTDRAVEGGITYFYKLADVDGRGNETLHGPVSVTVTPARFAVLSNQPNPFSQATSIRLSLAAAGHVSLRIYNVAGDLVRTLTDGEMTAGSHEVRWDGRDDLGNQASPGTYTCRASSGEQTQSRRLVLIR